MKRPTFDIYILWTFIYAKCCVTCVMFGTTLQPPRARSILSSHTPKRWGPDTSAAKRGLRVRRSQAWPECLQMFELWKQMFLLVFPFFPTLRSWCCVVCLFVSVITSQFCMWTYFPIASRSRQCTYGCGSVVKLYMHPKTFALPT